MSYFIYIYIYIYIYFVISRHRVSFFQCSATGLSESCASVESWWNEYMYTHQQHAARPCVASGVYTS